MAGTRVRARSRLVHPQFGRMTLMQADLETGRTHQIRVHMAHAGHPLLGDQVYGSGFRSSTTKLSEASKAALKALNRQALHAATLGFDHPISGKPMRFESPAPADIVTLLEALRLNVTQQ